MSDDREPREPWPVWLVVLVTAAVMVFLAGCVAVLLHPSSWPPMS